MVTVHMNKKVFTIRKIILVSLAFSMIFAISIFAATPKPTATKKPTVAPKAITQKTTTPKIVTSSKPKMEIDFKLNNQLGKSVQLSDYAGKKIYLKFWATWCPICLEGLEDLSKFNEEQKKSRKAIVLTVVSPNFSGEMNEADFKKWYKSQNLKFTVLLDDGGDIATKYGIRAYPTNVLINTKGKIERKLPGHFTNTMLDGYIKSIS